MREKHGEYMEIYFDEFYDDHPEYVRGHVTLEEAKAALDEWEHGLGDRAKAVTHCYARWVFSESQDYDRELNVYEQPQRGAFALTRVELHNVGLSEPCKVENVQTEKEG